CSIRVLHAHEPPRRAFRGNMHLLVARVAMPRRQSMQYLTGVKGRWGDPVVGDLEPRKAAFRPLHRQKELHCPLGAFPEAGMWQGTAQGEEGWYDVARGFRV